MLIALEPGLSVHRHRARLAAADDGALLLTDGAAGGHQIVDIRHPDLARSLLRLRLRLRPTEACQTDFLLLQQTHRAMISIGCDGALKVAAGAPVLEASCTSEEAGWWQLDITFRNFPPLLLLALGRPGTKFTGSGKAQFELRDGQIEVLERRWLPSPDDGLVILESGMPTQPDAAWLPHLPSLRTIICEVDETAGKAAMAARGDREDHILLPHVLFYRNGAGKLNTTRDRAFSSVLDPDQRRVKGFAHASAYEVTQPAKVPLVRFDGLSRQHALPTPDVLRIRANGAEFDVLRGFGAILDAVLGIEVRVYFYPLYRKQKLIGDVVDLLDGHGFALRRIAPLPVADTAYETAVATAYLTRRDVAGAALDKVAFIEEVWGVSWPR